MNIDLLLTNLTNPALLFFLLGIVAVQIKSDLEIPPNSARFISIYLLFAIGFKGGHELAHSTFTMEVFNTSLYGIVSSVVVPLFAFFILRVKFSTQNAAAIAAAYGSVSAVTFVTAISYLELQHIEFGGHMVAVMAMMEAPAIVVGVFLLNKFSEKKESSLSLSKVIHHSFTNSSVLLVLGSLIIGYLANDEQAMEIKPFTTDIFKGFLAIFLLDMGIASGKKLGDFLKRGWSASLFAIFFPALLGNSTALLSAALTSSVGDRFILSILVASASYIAVPAAMKIAAPKANPGVYIPMALAITFPFNITIGMPLYYMIILAS